MAESDSATTYSHEKTQLKRRTESFNDVFRIFALGYTAVPQMPLSFGGLAAQQMATKRTTVLGFTGRRYLKPAFHPFVSFLLWHDSSPNEDMALNSNSSCPSEVNVRPPQVFPIMHQNATEVNECILSWQHRAKEYSRLLSAKSSSVAGNQQKGTGWSPDSDFQGA